MNFNKHQKWEIPTGWRYGLMGGILITAALMIWFLLQVGISTTSLIIIISIIISVSMISVMILKRIAYVEKIAGEQSKKPGYWANIGAMWYMEGVRYRMGVFAEFLISFLLTGLAILNFRVQGFTKSTAILFGLSFGFLIYGFILWKVATTLEKRALNLFLGKKKAAALLFSFLTSLSGLSMVFVAISQLLLMSSRSSGFFYLLFGLALIIGGLFYTHKALKR